MFTSLIILIVSLILIWATLGFMIYLNIKDNYLKQLLFYSSLLLFANWLVVTLLFWYYKN